MASVAGLKAGRVQRAAAGAACGAALRAGGAARLSTRLLVGQLAHRLALAGVHKLAGDCARAPLSVTAMQSRHVSTCRRCWRMQPLLRCRARPAEARTHDSLRRAVVVAAAAEAPAAASKATSGRRPAAEAAASAAAAVAAAATAAAEAAAARRRSPHRAQEAAQVAGRVPPAA